MKIKYQTSLILYLALFLFNISLLGFGSIREGITKFGKKIVIQKNYEDALESFAQKDAFVGGLVTELNNNEELIKQLDNIVPNRSEEEKYLVDLSLQAARAGYEVRGMSVQKSSPTQTNIALRFKGNLKSLDKLADAISSTERLSKTDTISAKMNRDEGDVTVTLVIYSYSEDLK